MQSETENGALMPAIQRYEGCLIASHTHLKQLAVAPFAGGRFLSHAICILSQRIAGKMEKVPKND
jgi:hypothetical protein